jgi:hypothetical protein
MQFHKPSFRLRSIVLAAATAFVGFLCFVSAVKGCSPQEEETEAAAPDWPDGFVELDPANSAAPAASAR